MEVRYAREYVEGSRVDSVFVLRSREMRATRNGDAYLSLEVGDRSGSLPAVQFRPSSAASSIPVGAAVRIRGTVTCFRGVRRISVDSMDPAEKWSPEDLIECGPRSTDELTRELKELVRSVSHPRLRRLLSTVFSESSLFEAFIACPASQSHHHAYLGGLLEHTVAVASLCSTFAERYERIDRDLLMTAALLHDIGKVDELSYSTGITYTDQGRMVGHVVLSTLRVRDAARKVPLEPELLLRLEHALLSHHGELEWGSPKRPATLEALVLHHADNLDAKAAGFAQTVKGACLIDESWTDATNLFGRPLYSPPQSSERAVESMGAPGVHLEKSA